jgi:hypothetical protein
MICPSPQISKQSVQGKFHRVKRSSYFEAELGFIMDNVEAVKNLSNTINNRMMYYPDPLVNNFSEPSSIKKFKGEVLIFEVSCIKRLKLICKHVSSIMAHFYLILKLFIQSGLYDLILSK